MVKKIIKMKFEKQIPRIFLIGIIWGLIEILISPVIKSFQPALFGFVMPFITVLIILIGRNYVPAYGSIILMGIIASVMKYLLSGMVLHGAFMAILLEALLAEIILSIFNMNLLSYILVGISVELYSAFHPLLSRGIFFQSAHFIKFNRLLISVFDLDPAAMSRDVISIILFSTHIILGILAGLLFFWIKTYLVSFIEGKKQTIHSIK
jgi:hypothetical protein